METLVTREEIQEVLKQAKKQFISISISNDLGQWSEQFFALQEIREVKDGSEKITMLLLNSPKNSECTVINAQYIHGIKFNKYLYLNGSLLDQVAVVTKDKTQPLSRHLSNA